MKLIRSAFDISDSIQWYRSDGVQTKTQKSNSINLVYRVYRKILLKIFGVDIAATYQSQIQDCKTRQDELKCKEDINKLIQDKKDIILDLFDQELKTEIATSRVELETSFIKLEIFRLLKLNPSVSREYLEKNNTTPLRLKILGLMQE